MRGSRECFRCSGRDDSPPHASAVRTVTSDRSSGLPGEQQRACRGREAALPRAWREERLEAGGIPVMGGPEARRPRGDRS